jgi:hypothetical protein
MGEKNLQENSVLATYKEEGDNLNRNSILDAFISRYVTRIDLFGPPKSSFRVGK